MILFTCRSFVLKTETNIIVFIALLSCKYVFFNKLFLHSLIRHFCNRQKHIIAIKKQISAEQLRKII